MDINNLKPLRTAKTCPKCGEERFRFDDGIECDKFYLRYENLYVGEVIRVCCCRCDYNFYEACLDSKDNGDVV